MNPGCTTSRADCERPLTYHPALIGRHFFWNSSALILALVRATHTNNASRHWQSRESEGYRSVIAMKSVSHLVLIVTAVLCNDLYRRHHTMRRLQSEQHSHKPVFLEWFNTGITSGRFDRFDRNNIGV